MNRSGVHAKEIPGPMLSTLTLQFLKRQNPGQILHVHHKTFVPSCVKYLFIEHLRAMHYAR